MKSRKIPSFLLKLYSILENENFSNVVHWKENGKSFAIVNFNRFIDEVLPSYYKHKNFASFVRQLNMYDFHKERAKVDEFAFGHKKFIRGNKKMLRMIKRKIKEKQETIEMIKEDLSKISINSIEYRLYLKILNGKTPTQAVNEIADENFNNDIKPNGTTQIWKYYNKIKKIIKV